MSEPVPKIGVTVPLGGPVGVGPWGWVSSPLSVGPRGGGSLPPAVLEVDRRPMTSPFSV